MENGSFQMLGFYYEIFVNAVFVSNKPLELLGVHQRLVPRVFLEKLPPLLEEDHHLWLVWRESSKHAIVAFSAPLFLWKIKHFSQISSFFVLENVSFFFQFGWNYRVQKG